MSTVATKLLTAEEFWASPLNGKHRELVAGEVVETMPTGGLHAVVAGHLIEQLRSWARSGDRGAVGPEAGFILARDPDVVRAPDVFFVSKSRFPPAGIPEAFWPIAPDLAVEVISPSEAAEEVHDKVLEYLDAGTPTVWVIYPRSQEVVIHTPDRLARTLGKNEILQDAKVLPGFRCAVAELFR